jgi:hypothetical protein
VLFGSKGDSIICKFIDVIFISVLLLVSVYGCGDRCILIDLVVSVAILIIIIDAAV